MDSHLAVLEPMPGLVLYDGSGMADSIGRFTRIVAGTAFHQLTGTIGNELRLLSTGFDYGYSFEFEGIASQVYGTDDVRFEIQYGAEETPLIKVEDILTTPMTSVDFDTWLDSQMLAALTALQSEGGE